VTVRVQDAPLRNKGHGNCELLEFGNDLPFRCVSPTEMKCEEAKFDE